MAQHQFNDLCKREGFCCPWAYMCAAKKYRTAVLAKHLGVDPRTIRQWKAKFKAHKLHCQMLPECLKDFLPMHPLDEG